MPAAITQLYPVPPFNPSAELDEDDLVNLYSPVDRARRLVRANFVSSIDGSATADGLSGGLSSEADKRVFRVLRMLSDVVLVAAGTARAEGYKDLRLNDAAVAYRRQHGLAPQPVLAVVTQSLDLDPTGPMFANASVRPIVMTTSDADASRRAALEEVADVVVCGDASVDASECLDALTARGHNQILCEGGPRLLGDLVRADLLDELCLTVSPVLEGGMGPRITHSDTDIDIATLQLDHLLIAESMLITKYSRRADA